jgi:anti-sigma regulatory factor (Ser/Thr protein kinase)
MLNETPNINPVEKLPGVEINNWVLPMDLKLIDHVAEVFVKKLEKEAGLDPDSIQVSRLQIGLMEALANAMCHGNAGVKVPLGSTKSLKDLFNEELEKHPEKKYLKIWIKIDIKKEDINIKIKDQGKGFEKKEMPESLKGNMEISGRGGSMMSKFYEVGNYMEGQHHVTTLYKKFEKEPEK